MAAFEVFKRTEYRRASSKPQVTIAQRGVFSLNKAAHAALGAPEAIEYLFDSEAGVVGLRAVSRDAPTAYPLRKSGHTYRSGASAFTTHCGIDVSQARRHTAEIEDGILRISLKDGVLVTSNRVKRSGPAAPPHE